MAAGVDRAPGLGHLVMVALGGELLEPVGDVAVALAPPTDVDVVEMVESLAAHELLTGRGRRPAADLEALHDLLHRLGALAGDLPEVAELDPNPVMARPDGVVPVDVRLRVTAGG